jgi:hypothetical protein
VWYGPDTYMGRNLAQLFTQLADLPDEVVRELHPAHTAASVRALLPRFKHYASGTCIVHHIFGGETCELVRKVGRVGERQWRSDWGSTRPGLQGRQFASCTAGDLASAGVTVVLF